MGIIDVMEIVVVLFEYGVECNGKLYFLAPFIKDRPCTRSVAVYPAQSIVYDSFHTPFITSVIPNPSFLRHKRILINFTVDETEEKEISICQGYI